MKRCFFTLILVFFVMVNLSMGQLNLAKLKTFEFQTIQLGSKAEVREIRKAQARYFSEDLGKGVTLDMVLIPEGSFVMGATDLDIQMDYEDVLKEKSLSMVDASMYSFERPQRKINTLSFFMGKFEVTQAQWKEIALLPKVNRTLKTSPSKFKGDNLPVEKVSWQDCQEFCSRLSLKTGKQYRLPTEEEWEYAARAGTTTLFHFGDVITTDLANYDGCSSPSSFTPKGIYRGKTTPVGSFGFANAFGLYDIHGNVEELCQYDSYRYDRPHTRMINSKYTKRRASRGGSFESGVSDCRSANRGGIRSLSEKSAIYGFRVVSLVLP
jgi:formylglycine-generating enzyme required for sulfatase activity